MRKGKNTKRSLEKSKEKKKNESRQEGESQTAKHWHSSRNT